MVNRKNDRWLKPLRHSAVFAEISGTPANSFGKRLVHVRFVELPFLKRLSSAGVKQGEQVSHFDKAHQFFVFVCC